MSVDVEDCKFCHDVPRKIAMLHNARNALALQYAIIIRQIRIEPQLLSSLSIYCVVYARGARGIKTRFS